MSSEPWLPALGDDKLEAIVFIHPSAFNKDPHLDPLPENAKVGTESYAKLAYKGYTILNALVTLSVSEREPEIDLPDIHVGFRLQGFMVFFCANCVRKQFIRTTIMSDAQLSYYARRFSLDQRLIMRVSRTKMRPGYLLRMNANVFKAYIAALYTKFGFMILQQWIKQLITPFIEFYRNKMLEDEDGLHEDESGEEIHASVDDAASNELEEESTESNAASNTSSSEREEKFHDDENIEFHDPRNWTRIPTPVANTSSSNTQTKTTKKKREYVSGSKHKDGARYHLRTYAREHSLKCTFDTKKTSDIKFLQREPRKIWESKVKLSNGMHGFARSGKRNDAEQNAAKSLLHQIKKSKGR